MESKTEAVTVDSYCGFKGDERPRSFTWRGVRREVEEVVERWYETHCEAGRERRATECFRVRIENGRVCVLEHYPARDEWTIRVPG